MTSVEGFESLVWFADPRPLSGPTVVQEGTHCGPKTFGDTGIYLPDGMRLTAVRDVDVTPGNAYLYLPGPVCTVSVPGTPLAVDVTVERNRAGSRWFGSVFHPSSDCFDSLDGALPRQIGNGSSSDLLRSNVFAAISQLRSWLPYVHVFSPDTPVEELLRLALDGPYTVRAAMRLLPSLPPEVQAAAALVRAFE